MAGSKKQDVEGKAPAMFMVAMTEKEATLIRRAIAHRVAHLDDAGYHGSLEDLEKASDRIYDALKFHREKERVNG